MKRVCNLLVTLLVLVLFTQCQSRTIRIPIITENPEYNGSLPEDYQLQGFSHWHGNPHEQLKIYSDCYDTCLITKLNGEIWDENYVIGYVFNILGSKEDFLLVTSKEVSYLFPSVEKEFWVKKGDLAVATALGESNGFDLIPLCEKPKVSKIVGVIKDRIFIPILDVKNNWIYTSIHTSNGFIYGWISPYYQCSNQITYCHRVYHKN